MRKISLLLAFVFLLCTACSGSAVQGDIRESEQTLSNVNDADNEAKGQETNDDRNDDKKDDEKKNDAAQSTITADKARSIAAAWLDEHPMETPYTLIPDYEEVSANGREYFAFNLDVIHMYWFSILVDKETGELLCRLTEDGMDPGPPVYERLNDWYDRYYGDYPSNLEILANILINSYDDCTLEIYWSNGTVTVFVREYYTMEWVMHGRDGNVRTVYPTFSLQGDEFLIGFPETTTRLYYLNNSFEGYFGDETFVWRLYY